MTFSIYAASVPLFRQLLGSLSAVLGKAAEFAAAKNIEPSVLLQARLAPDMFALVRQVQIASDAAKGCVARLAALEAPVYPESETSFAELQARIAKTLAYIDSVSADALDGGVAREISFEVGPPARRMTMRFRGSDYLIGWVIPNFTFHCATAYDILRHNGVDLGKRDFLGSVPLASSVQ
jgi:hypothetical protein